MPFDPQWPQNGQLVDADRFREQFTSLKTLIDAIQGGGISGVVVDAVNTLPAGSSASVEVSFDGSNVHFTFGIPQGSEGMAGSPGPAGSDGAAGAPGEVSQAQLDNAMGQTSNNSNAVGQMSISVDTSYNPSQMQAVFDKVDELILALRR